MKIDRKIIIKEIDTSRTRMKEDGKDLVYRSCRGSRKKDLELKSIVHLNPTHPNSGRNPAETAETLKNPIFGVFRNI